MKNSPAGEYDFSGTVEADPLQKIAALEERVAKLEEWKAYFCTLFHQQFGMTID